MKTSKFSDSQILAILKQGESGAPVSRLCRENARLKRMYTDALLDADILKEAMAKKW
jgi:putative transposase